MPNPTSVVLTDGVTPITLTPINKSAGEATFRSNNADTLGSQTTLKVMVREKNAFQRVYLRLDAPMSHVDADSGLTVVTEHSLFEGSIRIPSSLSATDRETFVRRAFSAIDDTALKAVLEDGEGIW